MTTKVTVAQKLDTLKTQWETYLTRSDVTEIERRAYQHALSLIEQARAEAPNKQLRVVQNGVLLAMGKAKDASIFILAGTMERWEMQGKIDAYRQLREDIGNV